MQSIDLVALRIGNNGVCGVLRDRIVLAIVAFERQQELAFSEQTRVPNFLCFESKPQPQRAGICLLHKRLLIDALVANARVNDWFGFTERAADRFRRMRGSHRH
jgi:hypothetical protein